MARERSKGLGQGPAGGFKPGSPPKPLDTSPEAQSARSKKAQSNKQAADERAREIVAAEGIGFVQARIRAAREALGIPSNGRPINKAEVRQAALDGSPIAICTLIEAAGDDRCSMETRVMASDKLLAHALKSEDDGTLGGLSIKIISGLPTP